MPYLGELSALLTAVLWSGTSIAFSSAAEKIGSLQLNINRMILASLFLTSTILIMGYDFDLSNSQFIYLIISGVIGLVIGDSFLFKSFQMIGARISMLLMALSPAMSAILAFIFLNEIITPTGIVGILITIAGIALVVLERNTNSKYQVTTLGIVYGILGALGQAGGLIFAKFAFNEGHIAGFVATFIRVFSSVIIFFPIMLMLKKYKNPYKIFSKDKSAFGATLLGTILGPFLGITFSLIAVANTKVGIAATLMSTMPIIMLPLVKYIYKEKLSWRAITGAVIAVGGVALIFLR
ncbi:MAG: DMT family transporter [Ignavibacteriaceae bacterium]|nr:DMT family transporter [Ignavibacterium sp.]MCC6254700.1 DMT family transporter [Ignavibacteriaceae bacterium]HRN26320.1 DMT family transporter [Ignavibacteriaceae bacterium]HRP94154.1 DMT family transporter [Ignavibacteriaceae bacterium]HRQ54711.1 DMT family transporter [Ignavibacteriaceae bacterium]